LDPFTIEPDWFILDFASFLIKANPQLPPEQRTAVDNTIEILGFNRDEDLIAERQTWVENFHNGIPLEHLEKMVPFIAYELKRQGLANRFI